MAEVKWTERATLAKEEILEYGSLKFGERAVKKLYEQFLEAQYQLTHFPFSGKREPLLEDFKKEYRGVVVHAHYKLVYYFDEAIDVIYITDIWDTRMSPTKLTRRFR